MTLSNPRQIMPASHNANGNILFLILIAVALFAALSFAITQSTRSSGGDVGKEKTQLLVDQLSQYSSILANAITRVILSNGCTINTISFDSPSWPAPNEYEYAAFSPANGSCNIFSAQGGAVVWQAPPYEALSDPSNLYGITGTMAVGQIGTAENELLMTVGVTRAVCLRANQQDGATNPGGEPPFHSDVNSAYPTPMPNAWAFGAWAQTNLGTRFPAAMGLGDSANAIELEGHYMGCYEAGGAGTGDYVFYQVLVPR